MVTLKEVQSKKDLKVFIKFPFSLYKDSPYWVPPLIKDELEAFDVNKNPVFETAEAQYFIAFKNNKVVGRIAAIINHIEIGSGLRKMRFGWFDFIDDQEVSQALLNKVAEIGKSKGMDFMEGPVGFSNMDKVGVMTYGFEHIATMITWYNHPYYQKHYENFGMTKEKGYTESKFPAANADPALFSKLNGIIKKRYGLRELNFTNAKEIIPWIDKMFDLFNESYSKLSSHVAITEKQKEYFKKKYMGFINPEYVKFVVDKEDEIIAFAIVMPSYSRALQKAKGKLFPFGFIHLLRARKHNKDAIFYLIGIKPEFQNKGVTAIIFNEYHDIFTKKGVNMCYRTPELEDNVAIRQLWKHFDPVAYVKRRTYKKDLH
jgi:hypothetical protein